MKISAFLSVVLACVFPAVALSVIKPFYTESVNETTYPECTMPDDAYPSHPVEVSTDSGVLRMELEDYICGVVLAEMPAEFEPEALKAQAVVARTYTCRRVEHPKHDSVDVCTDPNCCQAYISRYDYLGKGGTEASMEKVRSAVYDTRGEVLLYDGQLIEATYFSCSGGKTEDAQAVWGTDVPYLQSVESPGEERAIHYTDSITMPVQDFCTALDLNLTELRAFGVGRIRYTDGGGVSDIELGGITFAGTRVRQLLGLRSTAFVITWAGDSVTVTTKGFGHRVGMSQYGAEAMAVQGNDYKAILSHYYQGAAVADDFC